MDKRLNVQPLQHSCVLAFCQVLCCLHPFLTSFPLESINSEWNETKPQPFSPYCLPQSIFPQNPQEQHKQHSQEPLRAVVNCQEKSSQWPNHKQTCYGEMELAAKLPGFHVFLVPFKTYIGKKKALQYTVHIRYLYKQISILNSEWQLFARGILTWLVTNASCPWEMQHFWSMKNGPQDPIFIKWIGTGKLLQLQCCGYRRSVVQQTGYQP